MKRSPLDHLFDAPAQVGPILDLTGNGSLGEFGGEPGIERDAIRKLHWLAHGYMGGRILV